MSSNTRIFLCCITASAGLYVEEVIRVARQELLLECMISLMVNARCDVLCLGQYKLEAANQIQYRELVSRDPILQRHCNVPKVDVFTSSWNLIAVGL